MKGSVSLLKVVILTIAVLLLSSFTGAKDFTNRDAGINTIQGMVWDPYNNPLSDIYVELLNENYSTLARQKTAAGRFVFSGLSSGTFKVKILTFNTDYLEQVQDAQLINLTPSSSDQISLDFHLKFDPRRVNLGSGGLPEEIFVQEGITDEARSHYRKGLDLLASKKDKGLDEIEQALQIFPNYFDALNRLGNEYVQRREYQKAVPYLIRAIDVNQRSFSSFYALAYAAYQLKSIPEAIEAARACTIIKPASINAQLLYGTVLRINGTYEKSEKALLQAKSLSKKPFPEVHWQLALLYNKLGRNKEAADELDIFLKLQPDSVNKQEIQELIVKLRNSTT